ncbi:TonB-dependent hemoglobin/transferrin/lactoferrin family receptor [Celerinatantimonas sp. YJH-8]|uniref:TonB-dependent hemoglobin/transferrin/lactoferrin family receptor n=1 Tax=Celerinatantimonas sp. YJH-8 TaxID=3228714 RepID=UPI0038C244C4
MRSAYVWLSPICLSILGISSAWADDDASDQTTTVLNSVVVRGQQNTPAADSSTTSIGQEQMEQQLSGSLSQALEFEPGVDVASSGRFGVQSINIRGLDGDRVYQSIDGVTMADGYNPSGTYIQSGRDALDIESIASIDITKGGDVMAGSGALAGAVGFRTKSPDDFLKPTGDDHYRAIKTGFQSNNDEYSETLTYAQRLGAWEGLLIYTRRDGHETETQGTSDILGTSRGKADPGDHSSDNILAKLNYRFNASNQLGFVFEHYNLRSETSLKSQSSTTERQQANDHTTRTRFGVHQDLALRSWFADQLHWQFDVQNTQTTNGTHRVTASSNRYVDRFYDQNNYQFGGDIIKQLWDHRLRYGVNYQYQRFDNLNDDSSSTPTRMTPKAHGQVMALYLQDSWQLTDALKVMPAIRYDHYRYNTDTDTRLGSWDDNKNHAFTAQLGSEYQLLSTVSVFGKYGAGFRAPKIDEMYYFFGNDTPFGSYAITPNPDLKPEHSTFLEGGFRFHNQMASAEITAYYNRYRDFIETQVSQGPTARYTLGQFTSENLNKVVIKGIEFKGALDLSALTSTLNGFNLNGALAYAKGRNVGDAEPLNTISPLTIHSALSYQAATQDWGSTFHVTWRSGKDRSDLTNSNQWLETGGATVFDLTAFYKPIDDLTLRAGLFNLTDRKYWIWSDLAHASSTTVTNLDRLSQSGRHFAVNATYSF